MTGEALDPRREKLIAALYGELSKEEEAQLQAWLAEDEELRADWEELQAARAFLRQAEAPEPVPSFVFLDAESADRPVRGQAAASGVADRFWSRLTGPLRRVLPAPAMGFALATLALAILIVAGLRVDRVDDGLVLRFGPAEELLPEPTGMTAQNIPAGIPLTPVSDRAQGQANGVHAAPAVAAYGQGPYVTHEEFATYANEFVRLMASGFDDYEQRRSGQLIFMVRGLYDELAERQRRDRDELNARIEQALLGFVRARGQGIGQLESLPNLGDGYGIVPVQEPSIENSTGKREGDQHD